MVGGGTASKGPLVLRGPPIALCLTHRIRISFCYGKALERAPNASATETNYRRFCRKARSAASASG